MSLRTISAVPTTNGRHLPTIHQRVELERGTAHIDTSAFPEAKRGVFLTLSGISADMTPAEAIALGNALVKAGEHRRGPVALIHQQAAA
jgi:hypothetical protein